MTCMDKNQSDEIHSKFYHNYLPNFLHPNLNLFTIFSPHVRSSDLNYSSISGYMEK